MKKQNELLAKLKTSLPRPTVSSTPEPVTPKPAQESSILSVSGHRAPKLSISLFQSDVQRLDAIKDFMKSMGVRNLNDSEALRLACRSVEIGDHFLAVYRDMQREDGRRRPEVRKVG